MKFRGSKGGQGRKENVLVRTKGDGNKGVEAVELFQDFTKFMKEGWTYRLWHTVAAEVGRYSEMPRNPLLTPGVVSSGRGEGE